jgi:hypothetical protein
MSRFRVTWARTTRYGTTTYEIDDGYCLVIADRNGEMTCLDLDGQPVVSREITKDLRELVSRVRMRGGPVSQIA